MNDKKLLNSIDNLAYLKATGCFKEEVLKKTKYITKTSILFTFIINVLIPYYILNSEINGKLQFLIMAIIFIFNFFSILFSVDITQYIKRGFFQTLFNPFQILFNPLHKYITKKYFNVTIKNAKEYNQFVNNKVSLIYDTPSQLKQERLEDAYEYWSRAMNYSNDVEFKDECLKKIKQIKRREDELNQKIELFNEEKKEVDKILIDKKIIKKDKIIEEIKKNKNSESIIYILCYNLK